MDQTEKNVQTLFSMGFLDIEDIKNALRISHNDLSEAVAILTNDQVRYGPYSSAGPAEDVEMKDVTSTALVPTAAPPPYNSLPDAKPCSPKPDYGNTAFPQTNLYELEQRVFVDQWSIPYKKDESLAKCLIAATSLAKEGNHP
ncbi:hypothetical protein V5799_025579 [Amblyomma americanum]|uniref:UBA domain-containing protein n=1 Tax=Amblyomma americanum TaxID=6943 RepID=A0AAQ4DU73_AMBAM